MTTTNRPAAQAGSYRVGDLDLNRIGYGAMQLAGPGVFGPPRDRAAAIEVLRTAVELGVNHIDTADAYGPYITNEIIREALFPYGDHVHIVTKVGLVRDGRGGWLPANSPESWLLQRSPNVMLIPGTSSVDHLRENIAGAALALPPDAVAELDAI
jgi:pyridoxine 4-dehydrogenase